MDKKNRETAIRPFHLINYSLSSSIIHDQSSIIHHPLSVLIYLALIDYGVRYEVPVVRLSQEGIRWSFV